MQVQKCRKNHLFPWQLPFLNYYDYLHIFTFIESTAIQNKQGSLYEDKHAEYDWLTAQWLI